MMKIILALILLVLIVLEIRKLVISRKLNNMLALKQKQLRVKDDVVSLDNNSKRSPYFGLNLRLGASLALMFMLLVLPENNVNKPLHPDLKTSLLKSVSLNETEKVTSKASFFTASNILEDDLENKTIIDGNLVYTLLDNTLAVNELKNNEVSNLRKTKLEGYEANNIYKEGNHLFVVGEVLKEETKDEVIAPKLNDEYDTVIDVFDTKSLVHVNKLVFDGSLVNLDLHENQFSVVTKNDLFYELIDKDYILPWYTSDTYSREYNYDHLKYSDVTNSEAIYNTYTYNILDDFVRTYSIILSDDAVVKTLRNDLYILANTVDNDTVIYKIGSGSDYKELIVGGSIDDFKDLYFNRGNLYFLTTSQGEVIINKFDLNLENYESAKLTDFDSFNYGFVESMLIYGYNDVEIFNLSTMKLNDSFSKDNIVYFKRVSDSTIVALVREDDNYFVKILESYGTKISEVANYRIKSFENSSLNFVKYYESNSILLVGINRGNFDQLLYVFEIGTLGIESISIHDVTSLPSTIYTDANIIEQYLYLANNEEILVLNLLDKDDRTIIELK